MANITMTLDEWFQIPDNPRQRNTEDRARQWLRRRSDEYKPSHDDVVAASKNGTVLCKIDGHTRAFLWAAGTLASPPRGIVCVNIKRVKSLDEAAELYELYDSPLAVQTVADQLFGACHELGFGLSSGMLRRYKFAVVLQLVQGMHGSRSRMNIHDAVACWQSELQILDDWNLAYLPGPLISLALITTRIDDPAYPKKFFHGVANGLGTKDGKMSDGIQALFSHLAVRRAEKRMTGWDNIMDLCGRGLTAYNYWKQDRLVKAGLRYTDVKPLITKCLEGKPSGHH